MMDVIVSIGVMVVGAVGTILWWLLRGRAEASERNIETLFGKHDADAAALQELKLQIAGNHYLKHELDCKFDRLETTFRAGFESMGSKFDKLSDVLLDHMREETK